MTLSAEQIRKQVMTYLEATECELLEVSPLHVTVKLSPRADRMLTDRPYYWSFVERTGAEPQTLSFTFVFDPEAYDRTTGQAEAPRGTLPGIPGGASGAVPGSQAPAGAGLGSAAGGIAAGGMNPGGIPGTGSASTGEASPQEDSILARFFGVMPTLPRIGPGMIRREDVIYGSKRLGQIWAAAREEGRCLYLFEEAGSRQRTTLLSAAYEPWLGVCYKVEMSCDLKREELHYVGISLLSGTIVPDFGTLLESKSLTPRLPENIHIQPYSLSVANGAERLENWVTTQLAERDYTWAEEARRRLQLELELVDVYYSGLLKEEDEEKRQAAEEQYNRRRQETQWQYEPQISVSAVVYGLFHLRSL
ncbi:YqhG family protein [Paenibacillus sp. NFR01]|uniref:YqhG family protein n=1 Tax=Paenibacillus sp. NFR01 TaxID=1566279 RepID=UPI0008D486C1|nr:YqhG family protein [Paenibacillus sp. NFR01]SET03604.1 protein YqhG of unknown function [Paenibacillus sp. NFR01]